MKLKLVRCVRVSDVLNQQTLPGCRCAPPSRQSSRKMRERMSLTTQSKPSSSPSPVTALQPTMRQWRAPMEPRSSS